MIGAYVPFKLLLDDGREGKVELKEAKRKLKNKYNEVFCERKFKSIFSDLLIAVVYGVLLGVTLSPAKILIEDIGSGIGMGTITVIIAFVGWVEAKRWLTRKNKREVEDQEKADAE